MFLPCPLDLNGTKFSCKDGKERGEKEGGAWAGSWLLSYALEVKFKNLAGKLKFNFSLTDTVCVSRSWEEAAGFLELSGQHPFYSVFGSPLLKTPHRTRWSGEKNASQSHILKFRNKTYPERDLPALISMRLQ